MSPATPSRPTLQDVIELVGATDLPARRQADLRSAVRTIARVIGAPPGEIAAHPAGLRRRLEGIAPASHGLTPGRWNNIRSLGAKALSLVRPVLPGRSTVALLEGWAALSGGLPPNRRIQIQPLLRFLSARAVGPEGVRMEDLLAYRQAILEDSLRRRPEKAWDGVVWAWNTCAREIAGWPQLAIERASRRQDYILPWSAFPASLEQDCAAFLRRGSAIDLEGDGPLRPMRPATLRTWEYRVRACASILVHTGCAAGELRCIADIVTLERVQAILRFMMQRKAGQPTSGTTQMAAFLKMIARHWVRLDDAAIDAIAGIVRRLQRAHAGAGRVSRGLTDKNRERLRPFDDEATVEAFLAMPGRMRRQVEADPRPARVKAVKAQLAAAIALLQAVPLRLRNLAALELGRHLVRRGDRLYLVIEEDETKNRELVDVELPAQTIEIIDWYVRGYRVHLHGPGDFLFPGEAGAKRTITLAGQIRKAVFAQCGLHVNAHLFRHIAAKLYLDRRPGEYEVVRQVLRHRSITTTTNFYAGAEARSASRHFQAVVLERLAADRGNGK